jgi:predicted O-methyltransferase YrrM
MGMHGVPVGLKRRVKSVAAVLHRPPMFPPGHFYSPVTDPRDRNYAMAWRQQDVKGLDVRAAAQMDLIGQLAPAMTELRESARYTSQSRLNTQFGRADGAVLHAMLRHYQPGRYVEIGSGFSTAVALDTAESHLHDLRITCVEPFPARLLSRLRPADEVELIRQPVQTLDLGFFEALEPGDVLFIDSTHVVKSGSDVVYLFLHVLPVLRPGVIVHVHDIQWPFEYPQEWIREGRDWNEIYLVRALLTDSTRWHLLLMASWIMATHPDLVPAGLRCPPWHTGSLWMAADPVPVPPPR